VESHRNQPTPYAQSLCELGRRQRGIWFRFGTIADAHYLCDDFRSRCSARSWPSGIHTGIVRLLSVKAVTKRCTCRMPFSRSRHEVRWSLPGIRSSCCIRLLLALSPVRALSSWTSGPGLPVMVHPQSRMAASGDFRRQGQYSVRFGNFLG
jgi:hypothetical protein